MTNHKKYPMTVYISILLKISKLSFDIEIIFDQKKLFGLAIECLHVDSVKNINFGP